MVLKLYDNEWLYFISWKRVPKKLYFFLKVYIFLNSLDNDKRKDEAATYNLLYFEFSVWIAAGNFLDCFCTWWRWWHTTSYNHSRIKVHDESLAIIMTCISVQYSTTKSQTFYFFLFLVLFIFACFRVVSFFVCDILRCGTKYETGKHFAIYI